MTAQKNASVQTAVEAGRRSRKRKGRRAECKSRLAARIRSLWPATSIVPSAGPFTLFAGQRRHHTHGDEKDREERQRRAERFWEAIEWNEQRSTSISGITTALGTSLTIVRGNRVATRATYWPDRRSAAARAVQLLLADWLARRLPPVRERTAAIASKTNPQTAAVWRDRCPDTKTRRSTDRPRGEVGRRPRSWRIAVCRFDQWVCRRRNGLALDRRVRRHMAAKVFKPRSIAPVIDPASAHVSPTEHSRLGSSDG